MELKLELFDFQLVIAENKRNIKRGRVYCQLSLISVLLEFN